MRLAWLALFAAACPKTPPPEESTEASPPAHTVHALTFGWQVGDRARIDLTTTRTHHGADGVPRVDTLTLVETLSVGAGASPGELVLQRTPQDTPAITRTAPDAEPADPAVLAVLGAVARLRIPVRIGPEGDWRGPAEDALGAAWLAQRRTVRADTLATVSGEARPHLAALLDTALDPYDTPDILLDELAEQWNVTVDFWAEAELEDGVSYVLGSRVPHPALGDTLLPYDTRFRADGPTPCEGPDAEGPPSCVTLTLTTTPSPSEAYARAAEAHGHADVTHRIQHVVITDAATLHPRTHIRDELVRDGPVRTHTVTETVWDWRPAP